MLAGVRAPERSYGQVPPLFGDLTPAAVAYNSMLAGCAPAELPIVLSAVAACLDPAFNLLGIKTTTGTPTVAVIVHGPAAPDLGMNGGGNRSEEHTSESHPLIGTSYAVFCLKKKNIILLSNT